MVMLDPIQSAQVPMPVKWRESNVGKKIALTLLASIIIAALACATVGAMGTFAHQGASFNDLLDKIKSISLKTSLCAIVILFIPTTCLIGFLGVRSVIYRGDRGMYFKSFDDAVNFVEAKLTRVLDKEIPEAISN